MVSFLCSVGETLFATNVNSFLKKSKMAVHQRAWSAVNYLESSSW